MFLEKVALSLPLATLVVSWLLFVINQLFGVKISIVSVLLVLVCLILVFSRKVKTNMLHSDVSQFIKSIHAIQKNKIAVLLIFSILFLWGFVYVQNAVWPIADWDALTLYDMRARVLNNKGFFDEVIRGGYFLGYPPYTSFLHLFSYISGSNQAKVWYSLLYMSFSVGIFTLLRRKLPIVHSLFGSFLVTSYVDIVSLSTFAYTNIPYTVFLALGMLYLYNWIVGSSKTDLLLAGLLIGGSTWIRGYEPFWILGVLGVVIGVLIKRQHFVWGLISILAMILIRQPWISFVAEVTQAPIRGMTHSFTYLNTEQSILSLINKAVEVSIFVFNALWPAHKWYLLPMLFSIPLAFKKQNRSVLILFALYISCFAMILVGSFMFTFQFKDWKVIGGSLSRMALFMIPIGIVIVMLAMGKHTLFKSQSKAA